MKAGMLFDPALHGRSFVSGVVVNDEMEIKTGGGLLVNQFEKALPRPKSQVEWPRRCLLPAVAAACCVD